MADLPTRAYARFLDLAGAVLESRDPAMYARTITKELNECLDGALCLFLDDIDYDKRTGFVRAWSPGGLDRLPWQTLLRENMGEHPVARFYATHPDRLPMTITDVTSATTWHQAATYRTMSRLFGVDEQIAIPLHAPTGVIRSFLVCRASGDRIVDADRAFALRVQPLLARVDRHLAEFHRLLEASPPPFNPAERAAVLGVTPRELTVLTLMARGSSVASIAAQLSISPRTVAKHQENLYRKLRSSDRLTTVLRAQASGLVAPVAGNDDRG